MDLAIDQRSHGPRWSLAAGLPGLGLPAVTHLARGRATLAARRNGRIVIDGARLVAVHGRWWPHWSSLLDVWFDIRRRPLRSDRCELYYHQPWGAPNFLALSYVRSGPGTSLSTFYAATLVLDEIARWKRAHAIVAHITNPRISDRLLERWGWQAHCLSWPGRHFIKRFYGEYPEISRHWRSRLTLVDIDNTGGPSGVVGQSAKSPQQMQTALTQ